VLLELGRFIPSIEPPEDAGRVAARWFVWRGTTLLVDRGHGGSGAQVPVARGPEWLGLEALRTVYLGTLDGEHCFAAECDETVEAPEPMQWAGLRSLFGAIDDATFAVAGRAIQLVDWDRAHRFCGRCATPTEHKAGERSRVCPACGQTHYPRIAPVAMALVRRPGELLLARSPHFPPGMFSALAGFVEAGESLEECLHREVEEEVGVRVDGLRYFQSQPWPFPHSLMVAFHCEWTGGDIVPQAGEIEAADWFPIDRLPTLPHRLSIARRLIEDALAEMRGAA
jgi:NAD+ diphosphatase